MRRLVALAFGFAVAACGVPGVAVAQPAEDSVVGHFFDFADPEIDPNASEIVADFDVRSGASGENPSGSATWASRVDRWTASEISCLAVNGRTAVIGISGEVIDGFFGGPAVPIMGLLRIVDGGGPNSAEDSFEWALAEGSGVPPLPGPTDCSAYPSTFGPTSVRVLNRQGDVVVTDALPLPSTKQDCKNGGWRNFGVFKNQGDCVSFVATGGKNPPTNSR